MRKASINLSSYLLYLLPFAIITGPFIPDLFISIIGIIFLIITIKDKNWKYYNNNFTYFFFIFYFYLLFSSVNSEYILKSLESSFFYFRFGIFALAIWFLIDAKKNLVKNFSIIFLIIFLIALFDGYYQYFFDQSIFGYSSPGNRLNLIMNNDRILGGYLSRLFPLLIGLLIINFKIKRKSFLFLGAVLFILTDLLVYLSGERTALALLILSAILIIILVKKYKKIRIVTLIISLMIIFVVSIFDDQTRIRNIDHTLKQFSGGNSASQLISTDNMVILSPEHHSIYLTAWNIFLDNPILGVGPNNFRNVCHYEDYAYNHRSCSTHPHNTYIQLLSETGFIGLLFIVITGLYIFTKILQYSLPVAIFKAKSNNLSDTQICLLICFILTLIPFLPTQDFFNNWISIIYFLPIGFYLHSIYSIGDNQINH